MPDIPTDEFNRLIQSINHVFSERSIPIATDSELYYLKGEAQKFNDSSRDLSPGATDSETDESAVLTGYPLLNFWHLADSVASLCHANVAKLKETLTVLGSLKHADTVQEEQFYDAAYEVVSAADFYRSGLRPSFIATTQASRHQKRVEYLLLHKWPVECKRPRSRGSIISQAKNARTKIDERGQPGVVCISLDHVLSDNARFREYESIHHMQCTVSAQFQQFLSDRKTELVEKGTSEHVVALLFHLKLLGYLHDCERVSGPLLRCAIRRDGPIVSRDVMRSVRTLLAAPAG